MVGTVAKDSMDAVSPIGFRCYNVLRFRVGGHRRSAETRDTF